MTFSMAIMVSTMVHNYFDQQCYSYLKQYKYMVIAQVVNNQFFISKRHTLRIPVLSLFVLVILCYIFKASMFIMFMYALGHLLQ